MAGISPPDFQPAYESVHEQLLEKADAANDGDREAREWLGRGHLEQHTAVGDLHERRLGSLDLSKWLRMPLDSIRLTGHLVACEDELLPQTERTETMVTLYTFEGEDGTESTYTTFDARDAEEHARRWNLLCIANEYEFSDSETAWDFRREHEHEWGPVEHSRLSGNPHRKCQTPGCNEITLDFAEDDDSEGEWDF